jgi:tetratricopeptide (TPR) repeat protein
MRTSSAVLACAVVLVIAGGLAGCATAPAAPAKDVQAPPAKSLHSELYEGRASVAFASAPKVGSVDEMLAAGDEAARARRFDEALYLYIQAAEMDGRDSRALIRVGAVHEMRGNLPMAVKAYQMAGARAPDNLDLKEKTGLLQAQLGLESLARPMLEEVVTKDPGRWRSHDALGMLADRRGDHLGALVSYAAALGIEPRAASVWNNQGYSRMLAGDLVGAEADFRTALRLAPLDAAKSNLGTVLARRGRYSDALQVLLPLLGESEALYRVGAAALEAGQAAVARDYLERAARAAPTYFARAHEALLVANQQLEHAAGR